MADAAARRDARRRRILENSNSRLQRITGHTSSLESTEVEQQQQQQQAVAPEIDHNEFDRRFQHLLNVFGPMDELSTINNPQRDENHGDIPNFLGNGDIEGIFGQRLNPSDLLNFATQANRIPEKIEESPIRAFLSGPWVYVLLAAVANIMIILKIDHFYGTSILIPFFVVLSGRIAFCRETQNPLGSLFMGALILCNIRPQIIYPLKTFMKISTRVMKEICLYLSSFVVMYYLSSRMWLDIDELVPNKAEIIIDHSKEL